MSSLSLGYLRFLLGNKWTVVNNILSASINKNYISQAFFFGGGGYYSLTCMRDRTQLDIICKGTDPLFIRPTDIFLKVP